MNKNLIIAILVIVIIAVGAFLLFGNSAGKMDTQINIINNETFQSGEQVAFELKDSKGNALSGKTLNITYNNGKEKYSVTTDQKGRGYLTISGEDPGKYDVEVKFAGDDKYNGCTAKDTITITDELADNPGTASGDSVASTNQYNDNSNSGNNTDDSNPYPGSKGTYFIQKYFIWVRSSDHVVIDSYDGRGIGLTLNDWIAQYGDNPYPDSGSNSTNSTNG